MDGQERGRLTCEHRVVVRRAPVAFQLVKVPGHSYYQTLRDKLRWGAMPNFRVEPSGGCERIDDDSRPPGERGASTP